MAYPKLLKPCLASSCRKKYDLSLQSQLLFNVSQKLAVDEVSNIIVSRSSIFTLVVFILSKNNFMIVPFFDFLVFQGTIKLNSKKINVGMIHCKMLESFESRLTVLYVIMLKHLPRLFSPIELARYISFMF